MLWRVPPTRSRRSPPGFVSPARPLLVDKPPAGDGWLHEIKHDGYRIVALKDGDRVRLWSRHGTDFTDRFPAIVAAVRAVSANHALIDGEAVVLRPDGRSDFEALRTKIGGARATLIAFDMMAINGLDLRMTPLEERRDKLAELVHGVEAIHFSEALSAEGETVFAHACKLGLEGIVSKRAGSKYWSGATRQWVKSKNPQFQRT
jgi:bifunctional non-homologous end joining protein LigD